MTKITIVGKLDWLLAIGLVCSIGGTSWQLGVKTADIIFYLIMKVF